MSRPSVTVVMPFAGSSQEGWAAIAALLALARQEGDELILADNSGVVSARTDAAVRVIRAAAERSPGSRPQRRRRARARRLDPVPGRRLPRTHSVTRCVLRRAGRRSRRRARRGGRPGAGCLDARRTVRRREELPRPAGPSRPSVSPARGRRQPDGPPLARSSRSEASTRACARPRTPTSAGVCSRPGGGSSSAPARAWSIATGRRSATCAGSGAATPPAERGSRAATTDSSPSRRCPGPGAIAPTAPPARPRSAAPRAPRQRAAADDRADRADPAPCARRAARGRRADGAGAVESAGARTPAGSRPGRARGRALSGRRATRWSTSPARSGTRGSKPSAGPTRSTSTWRASSRSITARTTASPHGCSPR